MGLDTDSFAIEYRHYPSFEAEDRLERAYDLILDLVIPEMQNPEEDAAGVLPDAADAGGHVQERRVETSSLLGVSHVG